MSILNKSKFATIFVGGFLCGITYLISCGKVNVASGGTTRYVKANGSTVGEFLSVSLARSYTGSDNIIAVTSTGFMLPIGITGEVSSVDLIYSATDCQGTPHANHGVNKIIFRNGNSLFYISATAVTVSSFTYQSHKSDGVCQNTGVPNNYGAATPLTVNDPAITGVSQTSFTPPITIE